MVLDRVPGAEWSPMSSRSCSSPDPPGSGRSPRVLPLLAAFALVAACSPDPVPGRAPAPPSTPAHLRVLVVHNARDPGSIRVADHYSACRSIPAEHRVAIDIDPFEEVALAEYQGRVELPVRRFLREIAPGDSIDYIVLARGVPLRIRENGAAVDALLGAMDLAAEPPRGRSPAELRRLANPYFRATRRFRHREFGTYLVTRLDGYDVADAMALVDRALLARPERGPFLFDLDPRRDVEDYRVLNDAARQAAASLRARSLQVVLEETEAFVSGGRPLTGYFSWGSNDHAFDLATYRALRFRPGALAETAVSTSGRTFRPTTGGQSLVADLVARGVTGVKGYVSEPLTASLCRADILFDRYVAGYTLAESFAAASPLVKWKDVVVGDPLCAPYAPADPPERGDRRASPD